MWAVVAGSRSVELHLALRSWALAVAGEERMFDVVSVVIAAVVADTVRSSAAAAGRTENILAVAVVDRSRTVDIHHILLVLDHRTEDSHCTVVAAHNRTAETVDRVEKIVRQVGSLERRAGRCYRTRRYFES